MARSSKVAVSLDPEVLGAAERLRQRTGESRSALVNRALRSLVAEHTRQAEIGRYVAAYEEQPETDEDAAAAHDLASKTLAGLPW